MLCLTYISDLGLVCHVKDAMVWYHGWTTVLERSSFIHGSWTHITSMSFSHASCRLSSAMFLNWVSAHLNDSSISSIIIQHNPVNPCYAERSRNTGDSSNLEKRHIVLVCFVCVVKCQDFWVLLPLGDTPVGRLAIISAILVRFHIFCVWVVVQMMYQLLGVSSVI